MRLIFCSLLLFWSASFGFGDVIISELMYHPADTNVLKEFVELYNTGTSATDLSGWQLTKGVHFTFPTNSIITPGGYLVVAADSPTFEATYPGVTNFLAGWTGVLSDDG